MKRAVQKLAILGFVPVLTSTALGGTHTITTTKDGIVKLRSTDGNSQCSGAVIGIKPLTVLTAFHCVGDINQGKLVVILEKEKDKMRADISKFVSTSAISSVKLTSYPEYFVLQKSDRSLKKTIAQLKTTEAALAADPTNVELQEDVKNLRTNGQASYELRERSLEALKGKAAFTNEVTDLAILTFDKYDGDLNQQDASTLIAKGALVPLAPNSSITGTKVAFGGFGVTGLSQDGTPGSAAKGLGAFTNVVQKQNNGLIATFGMLPDNKESRIPAGEMGAILPGDSGGPLMSDYGLVGVASYIKPAPMETDRAPAAGWPVDRDGYYSYLTGRYADLSSPASLELIESARVAHKLNIEISDGENLALTDISAWNKPDNKPVSPLAPGLAPNVFASTH